MSGFGDFGTIVQSVDLIFMFLNWTTSLFVVIGALMVRGKRMLRDLRCSSPWIPGSCCCLPEAWTWIFPWRGY